MAPTSTTSATGAGLASWGFGVGPTCSRIWRPCLGRTWSASRRRRSPQHVSWVGSSRPRGDAPIRILLRRPLRAEPPRTHRPKRLAQPSPAPPGRAGAPACLGMRGKALRLSDSFPSFVSAEWRQPWFCRTYHGTQRPLLTQNDWRLPISAEISCGFSLVYLPRKPCVVPVPRALRATPCRRPRCTTHTMHDMDQSTPKNAASMGEAIAAPRRLHTAARDAGPGTTPRLQCACLPHAGVTAP